MGDGADMAMDCVIDEARDEFERLAKKQPEKSMDKLKTVNIKGKEYVEVSTRIVAFNGKYENGSISTDISYDGKYVRCTAKVTPDVSSPLRVFTGHAEEDREQGNINKTNATENCETSAVGRALAMMGIGVIDGVASADEVRHAVHKQTEAPKRDALDDAFAPVPQKEWRTCVGCSAQFEVNPKYPNARKCYPCAAAAKSASNMASG